MISTKTESVEISEELRKQLDELPDGLAHKVVLTPEQELILKTYYTKKDKSALAEFLGMSTSTMRKHYKELMKNGSGKAQA